MNKLIFYLIPCIFLVSCATTTPSNDGPPDDQPPTSQTAIPQTSIVTEEWTAVGVYPLLVAGEQIDYFANDFLAIVNKFKVDANSIHNIQFLVKSDANTPENDKGRLFGLNYEDEKGGWVMQDADDPEDPDDPEGTGRWEDYSDFVKNYDGQFIYTSLRIDYRNNGIKGVFYAKPYTYVRN